MLVSPLKEKFPFKVENYPLNCSARKSILLYDIIMIYVTNDVVRRE